MPRFIPDHELDQLMPIIEAISCPFQRAALLAARWSGARRGEIRRLPLDCLDRYPDGTPRLRLPAGKTYKERMVPIHQDAADALQTVIDMRKQCHDRPFIDERTGEPFAYYETIAGGMGARPDRNGVSGVHTHMTNSLNTPAEALEYAYPLRVTEYSLRKYSGGAGKFRGGDGIVREVELLADAEVTLLADRRSRGPYGLQGGSAGAAGRTEVVRQDGMSEILPGKTSVRLKQGDKVRIESPGGGGWGQS